jgi:hypothetical protein
VTRAGRCREDRAAAGAGSEPSRQRHGRPA